MTKRKVPESAVSDAVFPYENLWEELAPDWESIRIDKGTLAKIQARFEAARILGAPAQMCATKDQIFELLAPLDVEEHDRHKLAVGLYWLSGLYLLRDHNRYLNQGPQAVRKRLEYVTRAAKALNVALANLTAESMAALKLNRGLAPHTVKPGDTFEIVALMDITRDLALTCDHLINDIPRQGRGREIDTWRADWIWNSTAAVERWTRTQVQARQTDATGRMPRLIGTEGQVLLAYLRLISPKLKAATVVGVITERRRESSAKPAP